MPFLCWSGSGTPRYFKEVKSVAEIRKLSALNIPEGSCRVVDGKTYMHLPDKPVLALQGADSVLEPASTDKSRCFESDLKFL